MNVGEVEGRLLVHEGEIWKSAGPEDEALRDLEKQLALAEQQLDALRRLRPTLRRRLIIAIVALVGGLVLLVLGSNSRIVAISIIGSFVFIAAIIAILVILMVRLSDKLRRLRLRADLKPLRAQVAAARAALAHALLEKGLLPEVRKIVNEAIGPEYDTRFRFLSAQGLNESSDPRYEVPTQVGRRLKMLLAERTGGSIGITGPRGVGKTTLIRTACSGATVGGTDNGLVWAAVLSAPVEYEPREFMLYTFSTLCRTVLGPEAMDLAPDSYGWLRLLSAPHGDEGRGQARRVRHRRLRGTVRRWPEDEDPLLRVTSRLRDEAQGFLQEIEWQQTWTYGWSGSIKFPFFKSPVEMSGTRTRGGNLSKRPKAFPQVINDFRAFLTHTAASGRVIIGVDELDKVESDIAACRFLNDFKALFGIDRCFFLISLSEEAMSSFERRGLPFRDVFDSAFDEILRVPYLRLDDSIRILERRVTGLPVPFLWLCHCLSGGLARDLIRVARALVELNLPPGTELRDVCLSLVRQDLGVKAEAIAVAVRRWPMDPDVNNLLLWARQLPEMTGPQLLTHCSSFLSSRTQSHPKPQQDAIPSATEDRPDVVRLGLDMVTFVYLSATILDIFGLVSADSLLSEEGRGDIIARIENLARARQALTISPIITWQAISELRKTCQLPELPLLQCSADKV